MIFIWSNDGGPLQYAGLFIFALQFLLPQIMNVYTISMEIQNQLHIPLVAFTAAFLVLVTVLIVAKFWMLGSNHNLNGMNNSSASRATNRSTNAPLGSATNPVVVDDDDNENNTTSNNHARNNINHATNADFWEQCSAFFAELATLCDRSFRVLAQEVKLIHLLLAVGICIPLLLMKLVFPNYFNNELMVQWNDTQNLRLSIFAFLAHLFIAFSVYRMLNNNGDFRTYPGMRRGAGARGGAAAATARRFTVGEIESMVRKVPVEEFVSEQELKAGACSISKMKRMLVNRGASDALHRCVDRNDILEEIEKVRKFNEECTICAENYEEGDALRVLKCQHEFHLHCFDRWVYTFATDSRRGNNKPSCPLCKTELK